MQYLGFRSIANVDYIGNMKCSHEYFTALLSGTVHPVGNIVADMERMNISMNSISYISSNLEAEFAKFIFKSDMTIDGDNDINLVFMAPTLSMSTISESCDVEEDTLEFGAI